MLSAKLDFLNPVQYVMTCGSIKYVGGAVNVANKMKYFSHLKNIVVMLLYSLFQIIILISGDTVFNAHVCCLRFEIFMLFSS